MGKTRLEAFSDAVIAIVLTIMVLEMKVPHGEDFQALKPLIPVFLSYIMSFIYLGIYWNNHHHMLHTVHKVKASILWANNHLLFWLSLIPFTTGWMGENHFAPLPTTFYGIVLLMSAIAYWILQICIIRSQGPDSCLRKAVGKDWKSKVSLGFYLIGIGMALYLPFVSIALYVLVELLWIIPDARIEKLCAEET